MSWVTIAGLAAALLFMLFVMVRVERRALGFFTAVLVIPSLLLLAAWAQIFGHWPEVGVAAVVALAIAVGLGMLSGRLQRASSDTIKVWTQEKQVRPTATEAAAMRAELLQLKDEKERLEAELRRLKDSGG